MSAETGAALGRAARRVLLETWYGVLSTHSAALPGYPFGSVVPYALDAEGRPVILIANIAQHYRNVTADPRVSLIVLAPGEDVQAAGRLTLLADAEAVPLAEEDTAQRYYEYFPDARDYHLTHGFHFFRLRPVRARFIGGFGSIHWLAPETVLRPNPFPWALQRSMIEHMNSDHTDAMRAWCALAGLATGPDREPVLAGVDAEGCHLRLGSRVLRVEFARPAEDAAAVRREMAVLAREARAKLEATAPR